MKKNEIFTFTTPNGVEVTAVVIDKLEQTNGSFTDTLICYGENKLFTYIQHEHAGWDTKWKSVMEYKYGKVLVDYAILPDYDNMLESYLSKKYSEEEIDTLTEKEL